VKRFYARVEVVEGDDGHTVELDGRGIKTPAGKPLAIPSRALADRVSIEWVSQREEIDPLSMPFTGLCNAAIDRIRPNRNIVIGELSAYISSDPVRYRATAPDDLVAKQSKIWEPLLRDFEARFGQTLTTTTGLNAIEDPPEPVLCIRNYADAKDDFSLTAFANLTQHLGSVLIALGLTERVLDPDAAFEAAFLEELHQVDRWGVDDEAEERRQRIREDIASAFEFGDLAAKA